MSFWKDLAKGIASDYLQDRGAKGVVEDLGSIANSVKGFFSSEDGDDAEGYNLLDIYNECIEQEDYQDAIDLVEAHYEGETKDYLYHYLLGNAQMRIGQEKSDIKWMNRGISNYEKAKSMCPIGTDDSKLIKEELNDAKDIRNQYQSSTSKKIGKGSTNSMKSMPNGSSEETQKAETEYIVELKECLADGTISDKERRLLNRLRESLGISEERAKELERECNPRALSDKEQEYAAEVVVTLEDGEISKKERRLLDRFAKSLGISEERACEIEKMIAQK